MRAFGVCSSVMLTGVMVGMVGCNRTGSVPTNPQPVHLTSCQANPDEVKVKDMGRVQWFADDDGYKITFLNNVPPNSVGVPTVNEFTVPAGSFVTQTMHGPINCSSIGCYYKYNLTRIKNGVPENTFCNDPGVRIVP